MATSPVITANDAVTRREQSKAFMLAALETVADLGEDIGADPLMIMHCLDYINECIDDAYVDAIDAEEAAEPKINHREYSTLHVYRGSVVG